MGKKSADHGELDHVLLAMSNHEMKLLLGRVLGMLESFAQEINHSRSSAAEAAQVANRIAEMERVTGDMLASLDEMLVILGVTNPIINNMGVLVQSFAAEYTASRERERYGAIREKLASDLYELPPHVWSM